MTSVATDQTCCRLLTPAGMGAIAVIRVTGPAAVQAVGGLFQSKSGRANPQLDPQQPERLHYGSIAVGEETIDDVIVCASVAPDGQQQVDVNAHGGLRVVERILMALQDRGVSVVPQSEAAASTWLAANLIDAEVNTTLPAGKTQRAAVFLLRQRTVLVRHLEHLAAQAELDFSGATRGLQALHDGGETFRRLVDGATVAIIGPPNSGKSTLANRLFGAAKALVSDISGTTRDWVAEPTAICGIPVTVVDTPGVAAMSDPLDDLAVLRGRTRWADVDLRLLVLDGSSDLPDETTLDAIAGPHTPPAIAVANKCDLAPRWPDGDLPFDVSLGLVVVSALRGDGLVALEERIVSGLGLAAQEDSRPGLFTCRQRDLVARMLAQSGLDGQRLADSIRRELIGRG